MTFFYLLQENHYDWDRAKDIFYNLNDVKITWLNEVVRQERDKLERDREKAEKNASRNFGKRGIETNKKSFDLRE